MSFREFLLLFARVCLRTQLITPHDVIRQGSTLSYVWDVEVDRVDGIRMDDVSSQGMTVVVILLMATRNPANSPVEVTLGESTINYRVLIHVRLVVWDF